MLNSKAAIQTPTGCPALRYHFIGRYLKAVGGRAQHLPANYRLRHQLLPTHQLQLIVLITLLQNVLQISRCKNTKSRYSKVGRNCTACLAIALDLSALYCARCACCAMQQESRSSWAFILSRYMLWPELNWWPTKYPPFYRMIATRCPSYVPPPLNIHG
jgi:hypothetical protein